MKKKQKWSYHKMLIDGPESGRAGRENIWLSVRMVVALAPYFDLGPNIHIFFFRILDSHRLVHSTSNGKGDLQLVNFTPRESCS